MDSDEDEGNEVDEHGVINEKVDDDDLGSNPDDYMEDEKEEEGEDLAENWLDDYAPAPELDYYDPETLAKDDEPELYESFEKRVRDRLAAEEALDAMDNRRKEREGDTEKRLERVNRQEQQELDADEEVDEDEVDDKELNLEAFECPLREWIAEERTRREIFRRFKNFLITYYKGCEEVKRFQKRNENEKPMPPLPPHLRVHPSVYPPKIRAMCSRNSASLEVSYGDLAEMQSLLAIWLTDVPKDMLQIFDEVLQSVVQEDFPHYSKFVHQKVHIRIINLPISDRLRDLRQGDLNNLIRVSGVVTRRTGVFPQLMMATYICKTCNARLGPFNVVGNKEVRPSVCPNCEGQGPFTIDPTGTEYGNYQKIVLQETPGSVPPGRVPRHKDVILLGDLIDIARPGEEIEVTGIYQHSYQDIGRKNKNGFPVFSTVIEANCVQKKQDATSNVLSDEDKRMIEELSKDPQIRERIVRSIAPSIYGHRHVKTAVALSVFGGVAKEGGVHRVRGDINILLLGDPGTAKSQILKYAEKTAPRAVYTTGKGASAVGLTAGVHRDPITKEWTLEGGALVLADKGICLIDEFDKMSEQDRTSIHEAMEQQTISVSKAGIVTSLQARCAVLAAANPIGGRYDPSFTLAENVELTDPILQRFDILCVLQDTVDPVVDEKLAMFVVSSHMRSHSQYQHEANVLNGEDGHDSDEGGEPEDADGDGEYGYGEGKSEMPPTRNNSNYNNAFHDDGPEPLSQEMLKKYIMYAKAYVKPILHDVDTEKVASLYADLRQQSAISGGVPIAVRHIESIMRMSEASARMQLRDHVRQDDIDMGIKVVLESFLQSQKVSVRRSLARCFRKYITHGEEHHQLLMHELQKLVRQQEVFYELTKKPKTNETRVYITELENYAKNLNIFDLRPFYSCALFRNMGMHVDMEGGQIVKQYMS